MTATDDPMTERLASGEPPVRAPRRRLLIWLWVVGLAIVLLLAAAAWLVARIGTVRAEVAAVGPMVAELEAAAAAADPAAMDEALSGIAEHTQAARAAASDPVWRLAEVVPWVGGNLQAVRETAVVADDLVNAVAAPLVAIAGQANPETLFTADGAVDLERLAAIGSTVSAADEELVAISAVAAAIPTEGLIPDVQDAVDQVAAVVAKATEVVAAADKAASLAPSMLGGEGGRTYLVLVMNNAELRAQGGMPGFTAALTAVDGRLQLERTASTSDFDPVPERPLVATEAWEDQLYSSDIARRLQDVTATHDFRASARYASALAERIYGTTFDGVLAVDPYVLSYLLAATGPVALSDGETLESGNAVNTLLRDVYIRFPEPSRQDAFFAATVASVMADVTTGSFDRTALVSALARGVKEDRVRLWSADEAEQRTIETTALSGELPDGANGAVLGIYANDWTRSKMDFYLAAGADVVDLGCADGRHRASVTVTLQHTLNSDQAAALPEYVTGDGSRVARGSIGTQIVVVGPPGGTIDSAEGQDGDLGVVTATDGAGRPVAARTIVLAPDGSGVARVVVSWPTEEAGVAQVIHTPQITVADPGPAVEGCG